jgi:ubiquinol-cytochrome c reductase cytochrome c subunit
VNDDDDIDVEREFGFEPAVSATGALAEPGGKKRPRRRGLSLRRRIAATVLLGTGLVGMGIVYASFAASSGAADTGTSQQDIAAGRQLYQLSCITCHGANLDGIKGQGPSLIGVGGAAVYFQVSTGRMPATGQGADMPRKEAKFNERQTDQIAAYVESVGGGPSLPQGNLRGGAQSLGEGGELFRLNCASCHSVTGQGAPLSAGKIVPSLNNATDKQIVAAMLSGPENMPVFSDNQLTPAQKRAIIAYVQTLKASKDPGGAGLGRAGPMSETIVIFVAGIGAVVIAMMWIGAKSR